MISNYPISSYSGNNKIGFSGKYNPGEDLGNFYRKFERSPTPKVARVALLMKLGLPVTSKISVEELTAIAQKTIAKQNKESKKIKFGSIAEIGLNLLNIGFRLFRK